MTIIPVDALWNWIEEQEAGIERSSQNMATGGALQAFAAMKTKMTELGLVGPNSFESLTWAREKWEADVQAFYDDPGGYLGGTADTERVRETHNWLNRIGQQLGMEMSVTIAREATEYEVKRMESLLGTR